MYFVFLIFIEKKAKINSEIKINPEFRNEFRNSGFIFIDQKSDISLFYRIW